MPIIKIPTFNYEELNGKNLKIYTNKSEDGTVVVGIDQETNQMFVLKLEINTETPCIITTNSEGDSSGFELFKKIQAKRR